jgi:uncharacterized membrane protein
VIILATALFVFTNERGFSHEIPDAEWDIAVALAAFLLLLLLAARRRMPPWTAHAALACALVVDGLAAFRMGGLLGALLVGVVLAFVPRQAARFGIPPLVLLASLAANYPFLRALADPRNPSPLPGLEAFVAIVVPVLALPLVLADRDHRLLRWGVWLVGVGMLALLTERYFIRVASVVTPDDVLLTAGGAALVLVATRLRSARYARHVAATGVSAMVLVALLLMQGSSYVSDSPISIDEAARAMLRGQNPYVVVDIVDAARAHGISEDVFTHYADGSGVERKYPYPAGSFVPSTVLFAFGAQDVRYGFLALLVGLYAIVIMRSPAPIAPYVGAIALVNVMALRQVAFAGVEPSWALLIALALAVPSAAGMFAGLAASVRQTAWLYLPWIAIDRWRESTRSFFRWTALVAGTFVLVNFAFIVSSPAEWFASVTGPVVSLYEPLGFGIVRFSTDGPLPLLPRAVYTVAMLAGFGVALWTYWRHRTAWRYGVAVLPVAPLYFAWRSLQNYFMFAPVLLLSLIADDPD